MQSIVERLKQLEGSTGLRRLSYEDLCVHPNMELLEGNKTPKFKFYNRTEDPKVHRACIMISWKDSRKMRKEDENIHEKSH